MPGPQDRTLLPQARGPHEQVLVRGVGDRSAVEDGATVLKSRSCSSCLLRNSGRADSSRVSASVLRAEKNSADHFPLRYFAIACSHSGPIFGSVWAISAISGLTDADNAVRSYII